jgi:hypothetical protein
MKKLGYKFSYVKCVHCGCVYMSVRPLDCLDEDIECPACHKQGAAVCGNIPNKTEALKHLWA